MDAGRTLARLGVLDAMTPRQLAVLADVLERPIKGAAIDLIAALTLASGNVGLTTAAANLFGANPTALSIPSGGGGIVLPDPWGIAICAFSAVTGISAGATVTVNVVNQAGTTIGQGTEVNQGAGSANVGSIVVLAPLRGDNVAGIARTTAINAQGLVSAGTGTTVGSAAAPGVLAALSFLS